MCWSRISEHEKEIQAIEFCCQAAPLSREPQGWFGIFWFLCRSRSSSVCPHPRGQTWIAERIAELRRGGTASAHGKQFLIEVDDRVGLVMSSAQFLPVCDEDNDDAIRSAIERLIDWLILRELGA
jgi:hypothetical protein